MKNLITGLFAIIVLAAPVASADDLSEVFAKSQVIAFVNIRMGSSKPSDEIDNGCGYEYDGLVRTGIKGAKNGEHVLFRTVLPLELSGSYLVFLTDEIGESIRSQSLTWERVSSSKCASSGIALTPVEFLESKSHRRGQEIIFQQWYLDGEDAIGTDSRVAYFLARPELRALFEDVELPGRHMMTPLTLNVRNPMFRQTKIGYRAEDMLQFLAEACQGTEH